MMTERELCDLTDEEARQILDELRDEHPLNGALQDLGAFIMYTQEAEGNIKPEIALSLATAAERFIDAAMAELDVLQDVIQRLDDYSKGVHVAESSGRA
jgi:hypothetical protein